MTEKIHKAIRDEMRKAVEKLGGRPELLAAISWGRADKRAIYDEAELLAIVASWDNTMEDAEVPAALQDYNAGRPFWERRFTKRDPSSVIDGGREKP